MAQKKLPKPAWYKNTYFWIAGILFILCIVGLVSGDGTIRDPGQKHENLLWLLYLVASGIMLLNGILSHAQTVQHYVETVGPDATAPASKGSQSPPSAIEGTPASMPKMKPVEEVKEE